jgi:hypothetical protein
MYTMYWMWNVNVMSDTIQYHANIYIYALTNHTLRSIYLSPHESTEFQQPTDDTATTTSEDTTALVNDGINELNVNGDNTAKAIDEQAESKQFNQDDEGLLAL